MENRNANRLPLSNRRVNDYERKRELPFNCRVSSDCQEAGWTSAKSRP